MAKILPEVPRNELSRPYLCGNILVYFMKKTVFILAVALVSSFVSAANEPNLIGHVIARSIPEKNFKRISEYFDQKENSSGHIILRTQQSARAGYYFIISLQQSTLAALTDSSIELHYIKQGEHLHILETFTLPTPIPNSREIWLGLTGAQAVETDEAIMAWKIVIKKTDGSIIDSKESFLWKSPL